MVALANTPYSCPFWSWPPTADTCLDIVVDGLAISFHVLGSFGLGLRRCGGPVRAANETLNSPVVRGKRTCKSASRCPLMLLADRMTDMQGWMQEC